MEDRITRDEMLMQIAQITARRSTCDRKHVGAIIARDGRILTSGYNGAPAGMAHCNHSSDNQDIVTGTGDILIKKTTVEGCTRAVHAEANAIAYSARYGIDVSNSDLFTTLSPCLACAQLIVNSGISRVVCLELYRDIIGVRLLHDAGLEVVVVE